MCKRVLECWLYTAAYGFGALIFTVGAGAVGSWRSASDGVCVPVERYLLNWFEAKGPIMMGDQSFTELFAHNFRVAAVFMFLAVEFLAAFAWSCVSVASRASSVRNLGLANAI